MRARTKKLVPPTNEANEANADEREAAATREPAKALDSVARYLAARDHSLHELKTKLSRRYSPEVIAHALAEAEARHWLAPPEEISARAALAWARRQKSRRYIEGQLRKRQLPLPPRDEELERENVRALVEKKFGPPHELTFTERAKALRFLRFRGFDDHTIRMVFHAEP